MSQPRRSLGPVIAYLLTLLGVVLAGVWLWNALSAAPAPRDRPAAGVAPPRTAGRSPGSEDLSVTERQQLEDILRRKSAGARR